MTPDARGTDAPSRPIPSAAELDARRRERLAAVVADYEQVLITAAVFDDVPAALAAHTVRIEAGRIVESDAVVVPETPLTAPAETASAPAETASAPAEPAGTDASPAPDDSAEDAPEPDRG